MLNFTDQDTGL